MHAPPLLWMAVSVRTATCAFGARLQGVSRHLGYALVRRQLVYISPRTPHTVRRPSTYTMLVESDVQHGMRGILP
jgi:hypothetical protein